MKEIAGLINTTLLNYKQTERNKVIMLQNLQMLLKHSWVYDNLPPTIQLCIKKLP